MEDKEQADRLRVRDEARKWLGTPYHHRACVHGHGVDCAQLLVAAFSGAGMFEHFTPDVYSMDWHLHRGEEKYLRQVERYLRAVSDDERPIRARQTEDGLPVTLRTADVVMIKLGRTYSHSALVTDWPRVIHASAPAQIVEETDFMSTIMAYKPARVYSFWGV